MFFPRSRNSINTHIFDPPTLETYSQPFLKMLIFDLLGTHFHRFPFFQNLSPRPLTYPVLFPRLPPSFYFFIPAPAGNRTGHLPAPPPYSRFFYMKRTYILFEQNIFSVSRRHPLCMRSTYFLFEEDTCFFKKKTCSSGRRNIFSLKIHRRPRPRPLGNFRSARMPL